MTPDELSKLSPDELYALFNRMQSQIKSLKKRLAFLREDLDEAAAIIEDKLYHHAS